MNTYRQLAALALCALLVGCVQHTVKSTSVPDIQGSTEPIPEDLLLDVGIAIFDPGIDDYDEGEDERIYPEVRKAEARYMPNQLSQAMAQSGAWGAVRVVPELDRVSDLNVRGKILLSDGEELQLQIVAVDSRGFEWLDKTYSGRASQYAYRSTTRVQYDPFQAVYNTIANDLVRAQEKLRVEDRRNVRLVTELLFAQMLFF